MKGQNQHNRLDAVQSVFFNRQLEEISSALHDIKYEELKGFRFVPVNTSISPAKETFVWRQWDRVGSAKIIKSYAKDFPRADVFAVENTSRFKSLGAGYGYNLQEIRAASSEGIPLESRRAMAARRAIDELHERILRSGDVPADLGGFLNISAALDASGALGAEPWAAADDPDDILDDLHAVSNYMVEQTNDIEHPDTMLLPLSKYNLINTKRMGPGDGAMTIKAAFLANSEYVKNIYSWTPLATAGAGSGTRGIVYRRSTEVLEYLAPVLFEQFNAEQEGMEYKIPCHARTGGVICYLPKAVCYFDGI